MAKQLQAINTVPGTLVAHQGRKLAGFPWLTAVRAQPQQPVIDDLLQAA